MVYLDYAANCPVVKYPQQLYRNVLGEGYFLNPNTNYAYKEKRLLSEAENRVKKAIGAKGGKVIFGGTSSQLIENLVMAIRMRTDWNEISYQFYFSPYEHDSIEHFNESEYYEWDNFYVDSLKSIKMAIEDCSIDNIVPFVFWQGTQNITGEVFPAKQIGELIHEYNGFYICDGTAQIGHISIDPNIDDWCDFWCCSGHKAGTELGIGCCWVSDRLDKWLNGFKLHGTPNLAGALAMTQAIEDACDNHKLSQNSVYYGELLDYLIDGLNEKSIDFQLVPEYEENEPSNKFTLAINAIRLPGFNADALQQFLASKQVYISIGGSACAERHDYRVLENGYNLTKQEANEVIRVSFGEDSTAEEVKALVKNICEFKKIYLDN